MRLAEKRDQTAAFRDADQAATVLKLVFDEALPAYRRFHRDLLFHRTDESLFGRFLWAGCARLCCDKVRRGMSAIESSPAPSSSSMTMSAIGRSRVETQKLEAYRHEFVRPVPIYVRGAGISCGPEREVVAAR